MLIVMATGRIMQWLLLFCQWRGRVCGGEPWSSATGLQTPSPLAIVVLSIKVTMRIPPFLNENGNDKEKSLDYFDTILLQRTKKIARCSKQVSYHLLRDKSEMKFIQRMILMRMRKEKEVMFLLPSAVEQTNKSNCYLPILDMSWHSWQTKMETGKTEEKQQTWI